MQGLQSKLGQFTRDIQFNLFEFSLNIFNELSDKNIFITVKCYEHATSCVRDENTNTAPARHTLESGSLNWLQFMLQGFIRFPEFAEFSEFLIHLKNKIGRL